MQRELAELIDNLQSVDIKTKINSLTALGDLIEYDMWAPDDFRVVVKKIIQFLTKETDWEVRQPAFRNLTLALMKNIALNDVSFLPLIEIMDNTDTDFICSVIYILSMTSREEYYPVIHKYLNHENQKIRKESEEAIVYLNSEM